MATEKEIAHSGKVVIYQTEDSKTKVNVWFEDETVWLSQQQLAELFQTTKQNISLHMRNCFAEGELDENSVVKESLTTAADGKRYRTKRYNLDAIISVGYRIKSKIATQFRRWATERLKEYIIKGFTMDDDRLKNLGGGNYGLHCAIRCGADVWWAGDIENCRKDKSCRGHEQSRDGISEIPSTKPFSGRA